MTAPAERSGARRRSALLRTALGAALLVLAAATHGTPPAHAAGDGRGGFELRKLGSFDRPLYVAGPRGGKGVTFVVEQAGRIKMIKQSRKIGGTFLDITDRVQSGGERGLLSLAFDPRFRKSRKFFVYYTDSQGDIVVEQYKRHPSRPHKALRGSAKKILEIPHRDFSNHNGGQIEFGPKRLLYISTGDGGGGGDPLGNGQDRDSLLGKLLRIDPFGGSGGRPYGTPGGNPFKGRPGADEIFSIGLRNPFRFSFDRNRPKRIAIADVGQDRFEEVNYDTLNDARGANYGWNAFEGFARFPGGAPAPDRHDEPIHVQRHSDGNCSITGGYVARDQRVGSLFGRYLYVDLCKGQLRSLIPRLGGARRDRSTGINLGTGVAGFGEDRLGRIYVANLFSGEVSRIRPKR